MRGQLADKARLARAAMLGALGIGAITAPPAFAQTEKVLADRYCAGMVREFTYPDSTRADCISATHAIEVDFSPKWADAIGQALHYALWTKEISESPDIFPRWHFTIKTPRRAGIILVCRGDGSMETCANHVVRPFRIAEEFGIPLTIWQCDARTDMELGDCQRIDTPAR